MSHVGTWGKGTSEEGTISLTLSTSTTAILQRCAKADSGPQPNFSLARKRISNMKQAPESVSLSYNGLVAPLDEALIFCGFKPMSQENYVY